MRLFELLDQMNVEDGEKKSTLVCVCPDFVEAKTVKEGGVVSMGVPVQMLNQLFTEKVMPVLLLIDKSEYFKRIDQPATQSSDAVELLSKLLKHSKHEWDCSWLNNGNGYCSCGLKTLQSEISIFLKEKGAKR